MGRDSKIKTVAGSLKQFQSTRPVWGATRAGCGFGRDRRRISIHAPRMGRDWRGCRAHRQASDFNPRAPYGARPPAPAAPPSAFAYFNPRAPYGARLARRILPRALTAISIHAPRMGRDCRRPWACGECADFNPRAPYGARPERKAREQAAAEFQSTRPVWGAT